MESSFHRLTCCIARIMFQTSDTGVIHWPDDLGSCAPLRGRRCCPCGGRCGPCWSPWSRPLGPTSYWHRRTPWRRLAPGRYSVHCRNTETQAEKISTCQVRRGGLQLSRSCCGYSEINFSVTFPLLMFFSLKHFFLKVLLAWRMFWTYWGDTDAAAMQTSCEITACSATNHSCN